MSKTSTHKIGSPCSKCKKPRDKDWSYCSKCNAHYKRLYRYNLSQKQFDNLNFIDGCQLCGSKVKLVIDHCHKSNKVRGILCRNCNVSLGLLKDNVQTLKNAVKYLSRL